MPLYPATGPARTRFVVDRRPPRPRHDPWRHQGVSVEEERGAGGELARVATVFLTGRECPWRCVMCDLWRFTIDADTPPGAIPAQIAAARHAVLEIGGREIEGREIEGRNAIAGAERSSRVRAQFDAITQMKLYNAGSFFDPRAVPEEDYDAVAAHLAGLTRVIVESHPALVGRRVDRFLNALDRHGVVEGRRDDALLPGGECAASRDRLGLAPASPPAAAATAADGPPRLEVAMGLETAHPEALNRLHKRITLEQFARAAEALRTRNVDVRVFLLISPPFVPAQEQEAWLVRSVETAFSCGASVVALVPTRPGNGALDALAAAGLFDVPRLADIERSAAAALPLAHAGARGRVFVDLWDLEQFADCPHCFAARRARLHAMNLTQRVPGPPEIATVTAARTMAAAAAWPIMPATITTKGTGTSVATSTTSGRSEGGPPVAGAVPWAAGASSSIGWSTCAHCGDRVPS